MTIKVNMKAINPNESKDLIKKNRDHSKKGIRRAGRAAICSALVLGLLSGLTACGEKKPTERERYRERGISYIGEGRYMDAIVSLENALHHSNGLVGKMDYDISYYLALAEYKSGNKSEARNIYSAIIEMDDRQADAFYLRGKVNLLDNKLDEALADYNRAVDIDKYDHLLYERIYKDLSSQGYENEAKSYITLAQEKNSRLSDYQKGVYAYYLGNYDEARGIFEKERGKNDNAQVTAYLGKTYSKLGDDSYAAT
ncbi:MAG: tetratricopeptide repeat protein, partial [Lachnospiraceae bacterium]|nr:tetratricopeptide repeat protein [Lachnospiraceae bacterium]